MKTALKILAGAVGVLVVLVVAVALILPRLIDPNAHKAEIAAFVKERTGRDLRIEGDIGLTVFPWLGIEAGRVELGNAPGFAAPVFARTDEVDVRVKLLPLLSHRIELGTLAIHGLALNLARNAAGETNWADLVRAAGGARGTRAAGRRGRAPGGAAVPGIAALAIGGLDVEDASLTWTDAQAGTHYAVRKLHLRTGALASGRPVDLSLGFEFDGGEPPLTGHVEGAGRVSYAPRGPVVRLSGLEIDARLAGDSLPGGKATASFAAEVAYDGAKRSVVLDDLRVKAMDVAAKGRFAASGLGATPRYEGKLDVAQFDPRVLLKALGQAVPPTADPKALTRASASFALSGDARRLAVKPLRAKLDDSTVTGDLALADIARRAVRFDLTLDAIDVDRYLPPKPAGGAASKAGAGGPPPTPGAGAAGAARLPLAPLRALDVAGKLAAAHLKIAGLALSDLAATIRAKDGRIRLSPMSARLYQGTYSGDVRLDARGDTPRVSVDERLVDVQAGPLLRDLRGADRVTGKGSLSAQLTAAGPDAEAMKKTLDGRVEFLFDDGAIKGIDIARMLREADARLHGKSLPPSTAPPRTAFAELKGTVNFKNGIATNDDLRARSPLLRVEGRGRASLPAQTVDYSVTTSVVATTKGQGGADLADLAGVTIPIRVTGTFAEPKYTIDVAALARSIAKARAGELAKRQQEKIRSEVEQKLGGSGGGAKGLLEGLLGK